MNINNLFLEQFISLLDKDDHIISIFSNLTAYLHMNLKDINWVGFYFTDENNDLFLGPFQGKVACTKIKYNNGVCGSAVASNKILRVDNVHEFEGHIACDSASNSELVIPIQVNNKIIGVLDIDSPIFNRFSEDDEIVLSKAISYLEHFLSGYNEKISLML